MLLADTNLDSQVDHHGHRSVSSKHSQTISTPVREVTFGHVQPTKKKIRLVLAKRE